MKVFITDPAKEELQKIYRYQQRKGRGKTGRKIRTAITKKALLLKDQPYMGQIEEFLEDLGQGHRYLVEGHYKIIYRIIDQTIFNTDIFDSRQDPEKMKP